ncbi:MAG: type I polyketide synthase [Candidatus Omnitrophica bacterium]|nr:type I polyketide synthase [Candidatus Omnitrophota bacterium]
MKEENFKNPQSSIAIIGLGCQFPGEASDPRQYWDMLCKGTDAIVDIPESRWSMRKFYNADPERQGKIYAKQGGFLRKKLHSFDPLFFGISPREARHLDPQQRLLLEVTWEAFEDAGLVTQQITQSSTGVFIGGFNLDCMQIQMSPLNEETITSLSYTGGTMTLLANKISYIFDLKGPSMSIDTACSSSLVALHHACQSLLRGECTMAIAGGVNVIVNPLIFVTTAKGGFLSPHSRCMAFDERAAGYVRSEGAGVVILKPYEDAKKDNDPIYALIRGSGVNHDGHTAGISFPNGDAQRSLIRDVYRRAHISPSEIQYIEAHGTGTLAGDEAEAKALHDVLSEGRQKDDKCIVGSVKTNIGHLEAGAGIAGLIKAVLCLKEKKIPPNLHFEKPNPNIPFDDMCIRIPTEVEPWPEGKQKAYAGVNSFGFGGTNAHVLLEGVPQQQKSLSEGERRSGPVVVPLSARHPNALKELAEKYYSFLVSDEEGKNVSLENFCYSTSLRRSHHNHRYAFLVHNRDELCEQLKLFADNKLQLPFSFDKKSSAEKSPIVFVYTGMGSQWIGMGRELMVSIPIFRKTLEECDKLFKEISGWSIIDELCADKEQSKIHEAQVAQPVTVALQIALTAVWWSWGITPDAVIGHSVGEIAAFYASGVLSIKEALLVSYHRSRLQQTCVGSGTMLAVGSSAEEMTLLIQKYDQRVSIAAINSPHSVTLSGDRKTLKEIADHLAQQNIFHRFLTVDIAYHTHQMDAIHEDVIAALSSIEGHEPIIPLYSTVTGKQIKKDAVSAQYWWNNIRYPVQFSAAIEALIHDGFSHLLEIGSHPVLSHAIKECLLKQKVSGYVIHSLYRERPEVLTLLKNLTSLYMLGFPINWNALAPQSAQYVKLPTYPWQRGDYWSESDRSREYRCGQNEHPFLYNDLRQPDPTWEVELNENFFPFIKDHCLDHTVIFPGAAYVEAGLALHEKIFGKIQCTLEEIEFNRILVPDFKKIQRLRSTFNHKTKVFSVASAFLEEGAPWTQHAVGKMYPHTSSAIGIHHVDREEILRRCPHEIPTPLIYEALDQCGFNYGPFFQAMKQLWKGNDETLIKIEGHESLTKEAYYILHPTILDVTLQALVVGTVEDPENPHINSFIPVSIDQVTVYCRPGSVCWGHCKVTAQTKSALYGDITLFDENGVVAVAITGVMLQAMPEDRNKDQERINDLLYEFNWEEAPQPVVSVHDDRQETWLIFCEKSVVDLSAESSLTGFTDTVTRQLVPQGIAHLRVSAGDTYQKISDDHYHIRQGNADDSERLFGDVHDRQITTIVYLWGLTDEKPIATVNGNAVTDHCATLAALIQGLVKVSDDRAIQFAIVTRASHIVCSGEKKTDLTVTPLWGMGLVMANEYPHLRCKLIDIDHSVQETSITAIINECLSGNTEEEVAFRSEKRFVKRGKKVSLTFEAGTYQTELISTENPVQAELETPGKADSFFFREIARRQPGPDDIEIHVHATSLNFKDLLKVQGKLPQKVVEGTYFGDTLGMECSGTVVAVGENVKTLKKGDAVIGPLPGTFRSYATHPARYFMKKSPRLRFEEAPMIVAFEAAYYGLVDLAHLRKKERVLIHNAAGAVGLAAIQIAQWIGAEIFATAGNEEKREYLRSLGITHVMHSRDLSFADEIKKITAGKGVDVVISAMAGDALIKSFSLLASFGRFIEIGKRDIAENTGLPMRVFNRNVTFAALDTDRMMQERPHLIGLILRELNKGLEKGYFRALPMTLYPASKIGDAFKFMAQSKHIGKIVIDFHDQTVPVRRNIPKKETLKKDGTYLITGGTGGLGIEIAKWLSSKNVDTVVLVSRRGAVQSHVQQAIKRMQKAGTRVIAEAVDITDAACVEKLIGTIKNDLPPLRGIFHTAMVLDDGFIIDLNKERFRTVLAPKIVGALNLHTATQDQPLDFFISFSSIASLIGNIGQANYVAANTFLDEFAHYRRAHSFPATTVNLGVLAGVGIAAQNDKLDSLFRASGIKTLTVQKVLKALELIIEHDVTQIGLFDIDWARWARVYYKRPAFSRFQQLVEDSTHDGHASERSREVLHLLALLGEHERYEKMVSLLSDELAKILWSSAANIDIHQSISNIGVDSLMVLELKGVIETGLGLEISAMELLNGPTVAQIAQMLLKKIEPQIITIQEELLNKIEELSEDNVNQLLGNLMGLSIEDDNFKDIATLSLKERQELLRKLVKEREQKRIKSALEEPAQTPT